MVQLFVPRFVERYQHVKQNLSEFGREKKYICIVRVCACVCARTCILIYVFLRPYIYINLTKYLIYIEKAVDRTEDKTLDWIEDREDVAPLCRPLYIAVVDQWVAADISHNVPYAQIDHGQATEIIALFAVHRST